MAYLDHLPKAVGGGSAQRAEPVNIVISGTTMWNPGDDFVRDGVIAVLRRVIAPRPLNLFFYNFSADIQPPYGALGGIGNTVSAGDLERLGVAVDAVVIAGLSAGHEIKELYRWVLDAGLSDRVVMIGAGYENSYVEEHCKSEPESTVFRNARLITGRTERVPEFIASLGTAYSNIACPSLLSVAECKMPPRGHSVRSIGFSVQLPHEDGVVNQATDAEAADLAIRTMLELAERGYDITLIAHHKSEYLAFAPRFLGTSIKVRFQSFPGDLHDVYRDLDAVITTRLHAGLYANAHGLPALIINDTPRHTHALTHFRHARWASSEREVEACLGDLLSADLSAIACDLESDKARLFAEYDSVLRPVIESLIAPASGRDAMGPAVHAALGSVQVKRRVLSIIERLTPDHWLKVNIESLRTAIAAGDGWFDATTALNWIAGALEPATYIEVGVRRGRSLAQVLKESPGTHAYGFDLWIPDYGSIPEQGILVENPGAGFVADELRRLGLPMARALVQGSSRHTLSAFFTDPTNPQEIDLIHIDGDHTEEGARSDLEVAFERVAPGGAVIFDDLEHPSHPGLRGVWESFKAERSGWLFVEDTRRAGTAVAFRPPFDRLHAALASSSISRDPGLDEPILQASAELSIGSDPEHDIPVDYFTIVLNGMPFIEHHFDIFRRAGGDWHWHIVEGVGDLKHDTAWSLPHGGRIPGSIHSGGRSVDGTSAYLDRLVSAYPERVTLYRKPPGEFWDGKVEMVNAPLADLRRSSLLWQIDVDEFWTPEQLRDARALFSRHEEASAAFYSCDYFVGPDRVITTRGTYGNRPDTEWLRTWRYQPGDRWAAHEPPRLVRRMVDGAECDVASIAPLGHDTTEANGLVFQHFAYTTEAQLLFKESYYGYPNALAQWRRLQEATGFPLRLADYFDWVRDDAMVDVASAAGVRPILSVDQFSVPDRAPG